LARALHANLRGFMCQRVARQFSNPPFLSPSVALVIFFSSWPDSKLHTNSSPTPPHPTPTLSSRYDPSSCSLSDDGGVAGGGGGAGGGSTEVVIEHTGTPNLPSPAFPFLPLPLPPFHLCEHFLSLRER
jgi:hypothetical protein